jgi:hypothetical protein
MTLKIQLEDLCQLWNCSAADFQPACLAKFQAMSTNYSLVSPEDRDAHILHILRRLTEQKLARAVPENLQAFEAGWNENYEECLARGVSLAALKPKYVKPYALIRYHGDFVIPENPFLVDDLLSLAISFAFAKYLAEFNPIYEFGCGSGRYLFELSNLFPDKNLVGLDWTEASQKVLKLIAATGRSVEGVRFNMLQPATDYALTPGCAVITVGAMEQLGSRFQPFLDYLLANQPRLVVHHEPIPEFYSERTLYDYLALWYHRERDYLSGYWPALQRLAQEGRIEILEARRLHFGDPYNDPESLIVWRPR